MTKLEWALGRYVLLGSAGYLYGGPRFAAIWLLVSLGYQVLRACVGAIRKDLS
jgi:hypothetical protein